MEARHGEVPICHGRRAVDPHVPYAEATQVRLQVEVEVEVGVEVEVWV